MSPEIKFCGLTRAEDAAYAASVGALYGGVIFAGGPRARTPAHACEVLDAAKGLTRVGVFGEQSVQEIAEIAAVVRLDVVQLHADPSPALVRSVRMATGLLVWGALRLCGETLPSHAAALFDATDAVLIEPRVGGQLGGTGVSLNWDGIASSLSTVRGDRRVVLAGGLTPINVQQGVRILRPAVVDVSSGVESSPGIKDHQLLKAFAEAVAG